MANESFASKPFGRPADELGGELLAAYARLAETNEELEVANEELQVQNEELRAAREALESERRRYHDLFDFAPDGYLVTDLDGTILEANWAAAELLGVDQQLLPEKPLSLFVKSPDLTLLHERLDRLRDGEKMSRWEMRLFTRDAKAMDVAVKVSTASNGSGTPHALRWLIRDVTDRKQGEVQQQRLMAQVANDRQVVEELARSLVQERDLLQTVMENTTTCLAYLGADFQIQRLNLACMQAWGCLDDELPGSVPVPLHPLEDNRALFERVRDGGQPLSFRAVPLSLPAWRHGETGHWDWSLVPVKDADGQVQGLVLSMQDVAEQIREQRQVEERAARDQAILASLAEGLLIFDLQGNVQEMNQAALRIHGFRDLEQVYQHTSQFGPPWQVYQAAGRPLLPEEWPVARVLGGETFADVEVEIHDSRTGEVLTMSCNGAPVRDRDGRAILGIVTMHDVTAQKKAEAERERLLEENRRRSAEAQRQAKELETIFEAMVEGVVVYDTDDRPVQINRAAREAYGPALAGRDRPEIIRRLELRHLNGRPVDLPESPIDRALRGEVVHGDRYLFAHARNGDCIMAASAAPLYEDGRTVGAVAVWHDVTDQVRAEQLLEQQNRELQALTAELEAYDHTVAHDLKNPLAMVVGSADLLTGVLRNLTGEGPQRMLQGILQGSLRMNEIVDSLLLLSSTRGDEVTIEPVDMGQIVAEACEELAPAAGRQGAQIATPQEWPAAQGYVPWLRSVWVNYISNGLKYGGQPPRLELGYSVCGQGTAGNPAPPGVDPDQIWSRVANPDSKTLFWIQDQGPGLTDEEQARLFVPFSRLDRPQKLGHGLGLAIVRRVVERLGGEAGVHSRPGEGSTFWFTLPAA